jgi:hypothetical protein
MESLAMSSKESLFRKGLSSVNLLLLDEQNQFAHPSDTSHGTPRLHLNLFAQNRFPEFPFNRGEILELVNPTHHMPHTE